MSVCHTVVMVKKMVYLAAEQELIIKRLAREAKTSETEVIRRAITAYGQAEAAQVATDTRRVMAYVKMHPEGWADEPSEFFHG